MERRKVPNSIKELEPYYRGSRQVKRIQDGLPMMVIHNAIDLPLVRPAPNLTAEERNKPIVLTKELLWTPKDKNGILIKEEQEIIKQRISISYSNDKGMGAPSHRWYDIQMAIYERMQKDGYNKRELTWDGINWICKRIGANPPTVISDLEKAIGITVRAKKWFFNMQTGYYLDYTGRLFAKFERIREEGKKIPRKAVFKFDEDYLSYIQNNLMYSNRTYVAFFALKSTVAKMLLTRLVRTFHSRLPAKKESYIWRRDLIQLGKECALTTDNISNLKVDFNEAGKQLKEIGYIRNEKIVKEGKTESGYIAEFVYNWKPDPWKKGRIGYAKAPEITTTSSLDSSSEEKAFLSSKVKK